VTRAFDRPDTRAAHISTRHTQRLSVPARVCCNQTLRDHRTRWRGNDRQRVLVAVSVDTDHVVHQLCKHPDRSSVHRRVRCAGLEQGNRAAGL
jgi:hypothetical protein